MQSSILRKERFCPEWWTTPSRNGVTYGASGPPPQDFLKRSENGQQFWDMQGTYFSLLVISLFWLSVAGDWKALCPYQSKRSRRESGNFLEKIVSWEFSAKAIPLVAGSAANSRRARIWWLSNATTTGILALESGGDHLGHILFGWGKRTFTLINGPAPSVMRRVLP